MDNKVMEFKVNAHIEKLYQQIHEAVYRSAGQVSIAEVVGTLEIVKLEVVGALRDDD